MPTYVYECVKCRLRRELTQSITDENRPLCFEQDCDGQEMERVICPSSFQLKGPRWARDGYSGRD